VRNDHDLEVESLAALVLKTSDLVTVDGEGREVRSVEIEPTTSAPHPSPVCASAPLLSTVEHSSTVVTN
jgi:hypothetical protein